MNILSFVVILLLFLFQLRSQMASSGKDFAVCRIGRVVAIATDIVTADLKHERRRSRTNRSRFACADKSRLSFPRKNQVKRKQEEAKWSSSGFVQKVCQYLFEDKILIRGTPSKGDSGPFRDSTKYFTHHLGHFFLI